MVSYARFDTNGRYYMKGTVSVGADFLQDPDVYIGVVDPDTQYHDVLTHSPVNMPPKPGAFYDFDYGTKQWVSNDEAAWANVRATRDALLRASDYTQLPDSPMTATEVSGWRTYRQQLRDITSQLDPRAITWPTPPA